jgi:hypothetical protein
VFLVSDHYHLPLQSILKVLIKSIMPKGLASWQTIKADYLEKLAKPLVIFGVPTSKNNVFAL